MLTCPGCGDLAPPTAIHCGSCGKALLPFEEMVRRLNARARPTPPAARRYCPYCGRPCKHATCSYHADLPALEEVPRS